eukprot:3014152-Pyramimonas_sp.AAC.1
MTDGCLRSTKKQKLTLSHMSWRYGTQSCERKKELLEAAPLEDLVTVPTQMVPDQSEKRKLTCIMKRWA